MLPDCQILAFRQAIACTRYAQTAKVNMPFVSTISGVSVSVLKTGTRMKSRSSITTRTMQ